MELLLQDLLAVEPDLGDRRDPAEPQDDFFARLSRLGGEAATEPVLGRVEMSAGAHRARLLVAQRRSNGARHFGRNKAQAASRSGQSPAPG